MKKRILLVSVFLLAAIAVGILFPAATVFAADKPMKISASSVVASPGSEVEVAIMISDNPGITSLAVNVTYDSILTLETISFGSLFGSNGQTVTSQQPYRSPVKISWVNGTSNVSEDGIFATVKFKVADSIGAATYADIVISFDEDDIFDTSETNVESEAESGKISFASHTPGDVTGDGSVNNKDLTRLMKYIAGENVEFVEDALDINGDGVVNNKDLMRLLKFISGVPVEIY